MTMRTDDRRFWMVLDSGLRLGAAYAALVATLLAGAALRLAPATREVLVGVVVAAGSVALTWAVSSGVAALGWAFYTGFAENRYGELTFAAADLLRLAILVTVAVLVARGTSGPRRPRATAQTMAKAFATGRSDVRVHARR